MRRMSSELFPNDNGQALHSQTNRYICVCLDIFVLKNLKKTVLQI